MLLLSTEYAWPVCPRTKRHWARSERSSCLLYTSSHPRSGERRAELKVDWLHVGPAASPRGHYALRSTRLTCPDCSATMMVLRGPVGAILHRLGFIGNQHAVLQLLEELQRKSPVQTLERPAGSGMAPLIPT